MTQMTKIPLNTDLANVAIATICDWIANPIVRSDYTQRMQKGAQQSIVQTSEAESNSSIVRKLSFSRNDKKEYCTIKLDRNNTIAKRNYLNS